MDTEVGTSDNFHVSQTVFSWLVLMTSKWKKSSLACRACKEQAAEQLRLADYSLPCSLSSAEWQMTTNWAAESNTHWLFHSFCRPGVQVRPGWVLRVLKGCSQGVSQAVLSSGAWLGKNRLPSSFRLLAEFISCGCVTEGSDFQLTVSCSSLLCGLPQHGPELHQASKKGLIGCNSIIGRDVPPSLPYRMD